jgi:transcriptional regulator with XRE-family HTH domain
MIVTECPYTEVMADQEEYQYLGFGGAVRYHRKRLKLSQAELAERMQVAQATVSWWERQRDTINDPFMIFELADLFGVPADDLREGRVARGAVPLPISVGDGGMAEYIEGVVQAAPDGVDRDALRELLTLAADLPASELQALVAFGEFQRDRGKRTPRRRKVSGDSSGDTTPAGEE